MSPPNAVLALTLNPNKVITAYNDTIAQLQIHTKRMNTVWYPNRKEPCRSDNKQPHPGVPHVLQQKPSKSTMCRQGSKDWAGPRQSQKLNLQDIQLDFLHCAPRDGTGVATNTQIASPVPPSPSSTPLAITTLGLDDVCKGIDRSWNDDIPTNRREMPSTQIQSFGDPVTLSCECRLTQLVDLSV